MGELLCTDALHAKILSKVVELLDGPAFGTSAVRRRDQLARLMAQAGLYDVEGDGRDDLIADEVPVPVRSAPDVEPAPKVRDFRTDEQREQDEKLQGTWWRCEAHGITHEPVQLCHASYCPETDCMRAVLLVSTWRKGRAT